MDVPLAHKRDHHGAERVEEREGDGHDDAVRKQQVHRPPRARRAARVPRPEGAIPRGIAIPIGPVVPAISAVGRPTPRDERVGVLRQLRAPEVHPELVPPLMLRDPSLHTPRLKRATLPPRGDPRRRAPLQVHLAALPALAVITRDISRQYPLLDAGARQELEARVVVRRRRGVARPEAGADGDVAGAVGVHDEHVGAGHGGAGADGDPGVARRDGLDLEVEGVGGGGGGLGDADGHAELLGDGAVGLEGCGGGGDCRC